MEKADEHPDTYVRKLHVTYLDESREAVAKVLNAPRDECVFVKNATTGVGTVLHNILFQADEVIVYFEPVYGAVKYAIVSLQERSPVQARKVHFQYPIAEDEIVRRFREVVRHARDEGLKVRLAVFDTIVSHPGVRFPFERFTAICHEEGILSLIDGAHGIGHIHLDMSTLQPDFFVSNCHKYGILPARSLLISQQALTSYADFIGRWLFIPRSAAVLYVPKRNQHLIRTTLPTSWGFIPAPASPGTMASAPPQPNSPQARTPFERLFDFVATTDDSAYLCIPAALKFRAEVCGGEDAIISYCERVVNEGADAVTAILGTDVMQEPDLKPGEPSRMRQCAMRTVRLPIAVASSGETVEAGGSAPLATVSPEDVSGIYDWFKDQLLGQYNTFFPIFKHNTWLWVRLSGQVYLDKSDFEWVGGVLRDLCERISMGEYRMDTLKI